MPSTDGMINSDQHSNELYLKSLLHNYSQHRPIFFDLAICQHIHNTAAMESSNVNWS